MRSVQQESWAELRASLCALRATMLELEQRARPMLALVHAFQRPSAVNLLHYLALRQGDQRALQERLTGLGLSSLGRSEANVLSTIEAVIGVLEMLEAPAASHPREASSEVTGERGRALLKEHTDRLFGAAPEGRSVRVMVTLSAQDADDMERVRELVRSGMDCARINTAHDDVRVWRMMARNVRDASRSLGRPCLIAVDLPGPKCRTGALEPGPEVIKLRPQRGLLGEVLKPALAWLTSTSSLPGQGPALPVPAAFLAGLQMGAKLSLHDARGRRRHLRVVEVGPGAVGVSTDRTAYIQRGTLLRAAHGDATVGALPHVEVPLLLHVGDTLALTRGPRRGPAAQQPLEGRHVAGEIPCEPPELLGMVREGEPIWFDDGRIGGVVTHAGSDIVYVRITVARPQGEKLHAEKGINLPETHITLPAFGVEDEHALRFAAESADIVSQSFVRDPADVHALQDRLTALGRPELGIILKIETRAGFERLPELLLAAMRNQSSGVMIARGDLAVECGFERLAEVQEEILWLCEAAHMPVVWATQVLESVAKTGRATRAEVTDAAMGERAECVMLNKGPYLVQAVSVLDDILRRMSAHQDKKSAKFRSLRVAESFAQQLRELRGTAVDGVAAAGLVTRAPPSSHPGAPS